VADALLILRYVKAVSLVNPAFPKGVVLNR